MPGLVYGVDGDPGIRRLGRSRFRYVDELTGRPVAPEELDRIRALAIPPAWTDVWIAADPDRHLQATGRDARGRKQYRYHDEFRRQQEDAKFETLLAFGRELPRLRRRVAADLGRDGLPFERVVALVVRLLEETFVRIGGEEYARTNHSFGLTTLRDRHARMQGTRLRLHFNGKGAKVHDIDIDDRRLITLIRRCQDLPGQILFQYLDGDVPRPVRSTDVNGYIRAGTGLDVSAKSFRTWGASALAGSRLAAQPVPTSLADARRSANVALREVADSVHNTVAVCRRSYVHPKLLEDHLAGVFADRWASSSARGSPWLSADERRLLHYLERAHDAT